MAGCCLFSPTSCRSFQRGHRTLRRPWKPSSLIARTKPAWCACLHGLEIIVLSMNPCPSFLAATRGDRKLICRLLADQVQRYCWRVSGADIDRFDLHVALAHPCRSASLDANQPRRELAAVRERVTRRTSAAWRRVCPYPQRSRGGPSRLVSAFFSSMSIFTSCCLVVRSSYRRSCAARVCKALLWHARCRSGMTNRASRKATWRRRCLPLNWIAIRCRFPPRSAVGQIAPPKVRARCSLIRREPWPERKLKAVNESIATSRILRERRRAWRWVNVVPNKCL